MNGSNGSRRVYLLRHGHIGRGEVKRYIGLTDLPLSRKGLSQARDWGQRLKDVRFDGIYASYLARSWDMAAIITQGHGAMLTVLPELREIHLGQWEGLTVPEVQNRYPQEYRERGRDMVFYRIREGESFSDLQARVIPVFQDIVEGADGDILIVGHAGVNRVILCHLLGIPLHNLFMLRQDYSALNLIEYSGNLYQVVCLNTPRLDWSNHEPWEIPPWRNMYVRAEI